LCFDNTGKLHDFATGNNEPKQEGTCKYVKYRTIRKQEREKTGETWSWINRVAGVPRGRCVTTEQVFLTPKKCLSLIGGTAGKSRKHKEKSDPSRDNHHCRP
jgi:hypothetical protein